MKTFNVLKLNFALLGISTLFTRVTASPASTDVVVPFSAVGNVAAAQEAAGNGDTRLYSQNSAGDIVQVCVSNAFSNDAAHTFCGADNNDVIVPANETLYGTPIAVAVLPDPAGYGDIHLYFVSPDNVLSEYIYKPAFSGFRGGPSCSDCITTQGFRVVDGSEVLYAMPSATTARQLRVGFISQGAPGTITEAVFDGTSWQIAGLPN